MKTLIKFLVLTGLLPLVLNATPARHIKLHVEIKTKSFNIGDNLELLYSVHSDKPFYDVRFDLDLPQSFELIVGDTNSTLNLSSHVVSQIPIVVRPREIGTYEIVATVYGIDDNFREGRNLTIFIVIDSLGKGVVQTNTDIVNVNLGQAKAKRTNLRTISKEKYTSFFDFTTIKPVQPPLPFFNDDSLENRFSTSS